MKNFIEVTKKYFNQGSEEWVITDKGLFNVNHIVEVYENGFCLAINYQETPIQQHTVETYEELKILIEKAQQC